MKQGHSGVAHLGGVTEFEADMVYIRLFRHIVISESHVVDRRANGEHICMINDFSKTKYIDMIKAEIAQPPKYLVH